MNEVQEIVECPGCHGTGQEYSTHHHKQIQCLICVGRGWVVLESCKGCGYPAQTVWPLKGPPIVRYCGEKGCLAKLVVIHRSVKAQAEGPALKGGLQVIADFRARIQRDDAQEELKFKSRLL